MTPSQAVEEAARLGLSAIAVSDHDTVAGIDEALAAGSRLGIEVVPAIELNADYGSVEIHILGYLIDWRSAGLRQELERLRRARLDRSKKMVEKLRSIGVPVTIERVLEIAGSGSVGRPHVAQAIVEVGAAESMAAAFSRYLVRGAPAFVERMRMAPHDAVTLVAGSGGVAALAHPGQAGRDSLIPGLVKAGMGAIEVSYPGQTPDVAQHYQALARRFGLVATGGSDAHGFAGEAGAPIGGVTVDASVVQELRTAAQTHTM